MTKRQQGKHRSKSKNENEEDYGLKMKKLLEDREKKVHRVSKKKAKRKKR
jgi:hypothetical protein